jgi:hypothetical protein
MGRHKHSGKGLETHRMTDLSLTLSQNAGYSGRPRFRAHPTHGAKALQSHISDRCREEAAEILPGEVTRRLPRKVGANPRFPATPERSL